ncbi:MAG: electron transport complex subunit RsxD [Halothiobacillaceae bacterium]
MRFTTVASPHIAPNNDVSRLMRQVLLALVPGTLAAIYFFGWGVLLNILLTVAAGLLTEAVMLLLRHRPVKSFLADGSVIVTAWLLAVCLPPFAPWWLPVVGVSFALVFAKHLYGGIGYNLFNPAMVGYAVLLVSFPKEMTQWGLPVGVAAHSLDLLQSAGFVFTGALPAGVAWDGLSGATPLNVYKTELGQGADWQGIAQHSVFSGWAGVGWEWVALGWLAGGLWMLWQRVITWRIPVAMLASFSLLSLGFYLYDPAHFASPWFHLLSGGLMLGAFFIATDPVSGSTTPRGQIIYGAGIGVLVFVIRGFAGFPDGVAFAVLLMNIAVPLIDHYTPARPFGREKS